MCFPAIPAVLASAAGPSSLMASLGMHMPGILAAAKTTALQGAISSALPYALTGLQVKQGQDQKKDAKSARKSQELSSISDFDRKTSRRGRVSGPSRSRPGRRGLTVKRY